MRVPRGGLLLLLFAQPPAPGLHLAFSSKSNHLPTRSLHSVRLSCCKSVPGRQLGTLSCQRLQSGKFGYLLSRQGEGSKVGLNGNRSLECLSTSAEAVHSVKSDADADERRRQKWIADREAEQADVQRGKRVWVGDGKLVYSSKPPGSRGESFRQRGNGGVRDNETFSDSTTGEARDGVGSRGRGSWTGGLRGRGGGRGAGGRGRGRGDLAARDAQSSRTFEQTSSEGVNEESFDGSPGDLQRDFPASDRASRGTFTRGGSSRGGYARGQDSGSEFSSRGFSRGGAGRGGLSRGRGGATRGGFGRGESGREGFSRGGYSRGSLSRGSSSRGRGGASRGGVSRGRPVFNGGEEGEDDTGVDHGNTDSYDGGFARRGSFRGGSGRGSSGRGGLSSRGSYRGVSRGRPVFNGGDVSTEDENDTGVDNGSTDSYVGGSGRRGSFRGGSSRGSSGRGELSSRGSNRGGFIRGSFTRGGLSTGRGYGRRESYDESDSEADSESDVGFGMGRTVAGRGSFRGSANRGGFGRGTLENKAGSVASRENSGQFSDSRTYSEERGGPGSRERGGFSRGRGGSSRGGFTRDTVSRLDSDDVAIDDVRSERFSGQRRAGRDGGSLSGGDQSTENRLSVEAPSLSAKDGKSIAEDWGDSDDDGESLFDELSDDSDGEDSDVINAGSSDHPAGDDSDVLRKKRSETPVGEGGNVSSEERSQAKELEDIPAGSQRLQREAGEENWQFMVRKKRAEAHESKSTGLDVEDGVPEYQSEAYRKRKVAWLCKEIPYLGPRDTVNILNAQKRWITAVEAKEVIRHLMHIEHTIRAFRVHRWMIDQSWYEFDFELQTELGNLLCQLDTPRRARELFDQTIHAGKVPDSSTFVALTNMYIQERLAESIDEAWVLYNQMQQLGEYQPPASLQQALFHALLQKSQGTPIFAERADMLFQKMKESGAERTREMFEALMTYHAKKGNTIRVAALGEEMISEGIEVGSNSFSKLVDASAEEGSPEKAERAFKDLLDAGYTADVSVYISLMSAYGKTGEHAEALTKFEAMEEAGIKPNARAFDIIISIMANAGQQERAEALLQRMESVGRIPSVLTYTTVIEMYCKKGLTEQAEAVFKKMLSQERNPIKSTYVSLIEHYVGKGSLEDAEAMYEEMRDKISVPHKAYCLMLEAYGKAGQKDKLKELFEHPTSRRLSIPDECKQYLIGVVSRKEVEGRAETKVTLQKSQRKALMGLLLGGARVESHDRDRTYEVHFELDPRSPGASTVIEHLYQTFSEWAAAPPETIASQDDQGEQGSTKKGFATVSHGSFRFFSHQFRSQGKPTIPRLIHRWLSPECLAYWYMYGGERCDQTGGLILHVHDYPPKEIVMVRNALQRISLGCDVKERTGKRVLQFEGQSADWMWKLIEPYVVDDLKDMLKPVSKSEAAESSSSTRDDGGPPGRKCSSEDKPNEVGEFSSGKRDTEVVAKMPGTEVVQTI